MTVLVQDLFTGTNGTDISAHAPDIDVVGNGWLDSGSNEVELDGSSALKFSGSNKNCVIDTGTTDQIVTTNFNAGGSDNRSTVVLRANGIVNSGTQTYYNFNFRTDDATNSLQIYKTVSGSGALLTSSGNLGLSNSTTYEIKCRAVGSSLEFYIDGTLELSVTDTSITSGDYAGLEHQKYVNGNARFNDFLVEDTGSTTLANASITISKPTFSAAAQSIAPTINAAVAFLINSPVFASSAQALPPVVNAAVSFSIGKPEFSSTAQAIPPAAGGNANIVISKPVFASTAQSIAPSITANVAFNIAAPIFSATAQALGPNTNANASIEITKPQFNATAQSIGVDITATVSFNIVSPIFSIFAGGAVLEYYYAKETQIVLIEKSTIITAPNKSRTLGV
jgi:hypothetical protein